MKKQIMKRITVWIMIIFILTILIYGIYSIHYIKHLPRAWVGPAPSRQAIFDTWTYQEDVEVRTIAVRVILLDVAVLSIGGLFLYLLKD